MSMFRRIVLLSVVALLGPFAFATTYLPITNGDFSVPTLCSIGYAYQAGTGGCSSDPSAPPQQNFNGTPGFGWTFNGQAGVSGPFGNGLTDPNTIFNPPSFSGMPFTQAAFLQSDNGFVKQSIPGFDAGQDYVLTFYLGSRQSNGCCDGNQTVSALIDGNVIGTWAMNSFTPFTLENAFFSVPTSGSHTLEFVALNSGDHTAFLSGVTIAVPEPSSLVLLGSTLLGIIGLKRRF